MDFSKLIFRCSGLGDLMTESRSKSDPISETTKKALLKIWIELKYNRRKSIQNKYLEKGILQEEESITLYSSVKKDFLVNNKARMSNDFITGEWDVLKDGVVTDIKTAWDFETFFSHKLDGKMNKSYYWQLQGYMMLTGSKKGVIAYCLVNTREHLIESEKRSLWYKLGQPSLDDEKYLQSCDEIDKNSIFDDIPKEDRVIEQFVDRDEDAIEKLKERILTCRQWMAENFN